VTPSTTKSASYEILSEPSELRDGLRLQARRYLQMGYIESTPPCGYMTDAWTDIATHFGARADDGHLIGIARLIPYTEDLGLPSLDDFDLSPAGLDWIQDVDPSQVSEISALAVEPREDIDMSISRGLYRAMGQYTVANGARYWSAALAVRVGRLLCRVLDVRFSALGDPVFYRGAMTEPVIIDLINQVSVWRRCQPALADYFLEGIEIDLSVQGSESASNILRSLDRA
jgi:hypothetical protein